MKNINSLIYQQNFSVTNFRIISHTLSKTFETVKIRWTNVLLFLAATMQDMN